VRGIRPLGFLFLFVLGWEILENGYVGPSVMMHVCNLAFRVAEIRRITYQGQPGQKVSDPISINKSTPM
jgi:hypothetical protein